MKIQSQCQRVTGFPYKWNPYNRSIAGSCPRSVLKFEKSMCFYGIVVGTRTIYEIQSANLNFPALLRQGPALPNFMIRQEYQTSHNQVHRNSLQDLLIFCLFVQSSVLSQIEIQVQFYNMCLQHYWDAKLSKRLARLAKIWVFCLKK